MACDQGGISYKSQKCLRQSPENWVVVKGTHEPIIDPEAFQKVQLLVNSRKHTRSRTYDFLLKGLIFCHECGYPMQYSTARMPLGRIACSLAAGLSASR